MPTFSQLLSEQLLCGGGNGIKLTGPLKEDPLSVDNWQWPASSCSQFATCASSRGIGTSFLALSSENVNSCQLGRALRTPAAYHDEAGLYARRRGGNAVSSFVTQVERKAEMGAQAVEERLKVHKGELEKVESIEKEEADILEKRKKELKKLEKHKKGTFETQSGLESSKKNAKQEVDEAQKELRKRHKATEDKLEPYTQDERDLKAAQEIQKQTKRHAEKLQEDIALTEEEKKQMGVFEEPVPKDDCGCILGAGGGGEGEGKKFGPEGWNPASFECEEGTKGQTFDNNACDLMSAGPRIMKPVEFEFDHGFIKVKADKLATEGKPLIVIVATHEQPANTNDDKPPMPDVGTG